MATTTATKKGNATTTATTATTATGIDTTTATTATGIDTATTAIAAGIDTTTTTAETVSEVGVERVDWTGLASALNKIGYKNVLQIIPEGSYGGTFFVIIYEVKTK